MNLSGKLPSLANICSKVIIKSSSSYVLSTNKHVLNIAFQPCYNVNQNINRLTNE